MVLEMVIIPNVLSVYNLNEKLIYSLLKGATI